jgi:hypothetical protein
LRHNPCALDDLNVRVDALLAAEPTPAVLLGHVVAVIEPIRANLCAADNRVAREVARRPDDEVDRHGQEEDEGVEQPEPNLVQPELAGVAETDEQDGNEAVSAELCLMDE